MLVRVFVCWRWRSFFFFKLLTLTSVITSLLRLTRSAIFKNKRLATTNLFHKRTRNLPCWMILHVLVDLMQMLRNNFVIQPEHCDTFTNVWDRFSVTFSFGLTNSPSGIEWRSAIAPCFSLARWAICFQHSPGEDPMKGWLCNEIETINES